MEENNEISLHEVLVYSAFVQNTAKWFTNSEIAEMLSGHVARRTVSKHTLRLVGLGLLDMAEVFPAHKYRFSPKAKQRNVAYCKRLERATEVFSDSLLTKIFGSA